MAAMAAERSAEAPRDITSMVSTQLDLHLMFPILEFMDENQLYSKKTLLQAKLDLLKPTKMVEYAMDIHRELHGEEPPAEMQAQVDAVYANLEELKNGDALPLVELRADERKEEVEKLIADGKFTPEHLQENYDVVPAAISALFKYAKAWYECGDYEKSLRYLDHFRMLVDPASDQSFEALWGKYAAGEFCGAKEEHHRKACVVFFVRPSLCNTDDKEGRGLVRAKGVGNIKGGTQ